METTTGFLSQVCGDVEVPHHDHQGDEDLVLLLDGGRQDEDEEGDGQADVEGVVAGGEVGGEVGGGHLWILAAGHAPRVRPGAETTRVGWSRKGPVSPQSINQSIGFYW